MRAPEIELLPPEVQRRAVVPDSPLAALVGVRVLQLGRQGGGGSVTRPEPSGNGLRGGPVSRGGNRAAGTISGPPGAHRAERNEGGRFRSAQVFPLGPERVCSPFSALLALQP